MCTRLSWCLLQPLKVRSLVRFYFDSFGFGALGLGLVESKTYQWSQNCKTDPIPGIEPSTFFILSIFSYLRRSIHLLLYSTIVGQGLEATAYFSWVCAACTLATIPLGIFAAAKPHPRTSPILSDFPMGHFITKRETHLKMWEFNLFLTAAGLLRCYAFCSLCLMMFLFAASIANFAMFASTVNLDRPATTVLAHRHIKAVTSHHTMYHATTGTMIFILHS